MDFVKQLKSTSQSFSNKNVFRIKSNNYTYAEFYQFVDKIASHLTAKKQQKIVVATNNDVETYASIIAIWLTGNIYIPVNFNAKNEQTTTILSKINPDLILSSNKVEFRNNNDSKLLITRYLDKVIGDFNEVDIDNSDTAYILFTSGTTGVPKGVPISYQNLDAFVDSFLNEDFNLSENDIFLQMAELTFDMSIISFLIPLCIGASITTINEGEVKYLATFKELQHQKITTLVTAPSTLKLLEPYFSEIDLPHLQHTFVGAEAFNENIAQQWQQCAPNSTIINLYGPSEGGIMATSYQWDKNSLKAVNGIVSLGKEVKNIELYLVNELGNMVNAGQKGEAWITGNQVFDSYLSEEMNQGKFGYLTIDGKEKKCFRTGDILTKDEDGFLFYHGRTDQQVKIQGHRIELAELEHCAGKFTQQFQPIAMVYKNTLGHQQLALFIDNLTNKEELINFLKEQLPSYMIPAKLIQLVDLPLNKNQKVDKTILATYLNEYDEHIYQIIIENLYELFKYTATKNMCELISDNDFSAIVTKNSSWPNFTFNLQLNDVNVKNQLKKISDKIATNEIPNYVILTADQINQYEKELIEHNFMPLAEWACLKLSTENKHSILKNAIEIKKISDEEELTEWVKIASYGFEKLDYSLFQSCFNSKDFTFYAGYIGNKMIATALIFKQLDTAGIYHVVTLPAYRKKGYGTQLFSYCEHQAIDGGATYIIAQSTKEGLNAWLETGMKSYGNFYLFCWNKPK